MGFHFQNLIFQRVDRKEGPAEDLASWSLKDNGLIRQPKTQAVVPRPY